MTQDFTAVVSCGTLATATDTSFTWANSDVVVDSPFTGLHVTHVAIAGCVLNDTRREAATRGIDIAGVRVSVRGGFDVHGAVFAPIEYVVEVDSEAAQAEIDDLIGFVQAIAEIPRALSDSVDVFRADA